MRSKLTRISLMVFLVLWTVTPVAEVSAAVPQTMTYSGVLKNSSGGYLTGTYSMTFRLYDAATSGTLLWSETQSSVSVTSGEFSVELGSVTTLNLDFDDPYWLSIEVASDGEMTPRIKLTSAGYSLMADDVQNGFTQTEHDALSHNDIEGVKENRVLIAKTNFKHDAYASASANEMDSLIIDVFTDDSGIDDGSSTSYDWRGSTNYDVVVESSAGSVAEQSTSDSEMSEIISNSSSTYGGFGQTFEHSSAVTVDKATFKVTKVGSPTATFRIRLYSDSSGLPGTMLAESSDITAASISYTNPTYGEITYELDSAVALTANTPYHIVFERTSGSGDGSNHINIKRSSSSNPYADGTSITKNSSDVWSVYFSGYDTYFKVYEQASASGSATVISNAFSQSSAPAEAMVIAEETLNSGSITYSVSRDNGTTWTTCSKETLTDISSQPSGSSLRWKAVITDDAELDAIAISI